MNNIFLDLGTHYGQGLREFIARFSMNDTWIIHTFEANPVTYNKFLDEYLKETPWVIPHHNAISNNNNVMTLNIESPEGHGDTGQGTTLVPIENWNPWGLRDKGNFKYQYDVQCVDLSEFIKNNFAKEDNIIIKMDIEGSEYDTLEKMIDDGTIEYINFITIEWHSRFFTTNHSEIVYRENEILKKLQNYNITVESWK